MHWIALKMLVGDRAKFFGIVLGLTFAALLITQQGSIFCGLMGRTAGQIYDIQGADLWVMDPNVRYIDDVKPMIDSNLYRVRGVRGVEWAVPLYKGNGRAKLTSFEVDDHGEPVFAELPGASAPLDAEKLTLKVMLGGDGPPPRKFYVVHDPADADGVSRPVVDDAGRPVLTADPKAPGAPRFRFVAALPGRPDDDEPERYTIAAEAAPDDPITIRRVKHEVIEQVVLLGLDDASMIGAPRRLLAGDLKDLRQPDAVIVDYNRLQKLYPGEPWGVDQPGMHPDSEQKFDFVKDGVEWAKRELGLIPPSRPTWRQERAEANARFYERFVGRELEMNDKRAVIVGICEATRTFQSNAVVYTLLSRSKQFVPKERKMLSYILAKAEPGRSKHAVAASIREQTGLKARTDVEFKRDTIGYYMKYTGIPINFGITAMLGFIVGTAIAGQTFYNFTLDNIKQFGALKAMGTTNIRIVGMILLQALVVGLLGYGLGVGLAALFGEAGKGGELAFYTPMELLPITGVAVVLICVLSSVLSVRRVVMLEPAVVFRG